MPIQGTILSTLTAHCSTTQPPDLFISSTRIQVGSIVPPPRAMAIRTGRPSVDAVVPCLCAHSVLPGSPLRLGRRRNPPDLFKIPEGLEHALVEHVATVQHYIHVTIYVPQKVHQTSRTWIRPRHDGCQRCDLRRLVVQSANLCKLRP